MVVTSYYDAAAIDPQLARLGPVADVRRVRLGRRPTEDELIDMLGNAAVVLISDDPISDRVLSASPRLLMVGADGVGVTSIDVAAATARGVLVNNAPFVHEANGDFTLGLILALLRRIVAGDRCVRAGRWNERSRFVGRDLNGRTLGLLGFGRAARAVARRTAGFDIERLAYCRNPDRGAADRLGVRIVEFDELLARCDVLSIHVTLTAETRGMLGARELGRMKPGACLINTSRGPVVDEAALLAALRSGHLAAAALDVFDVEPPPPDHPLLAMDNVIVTAHIASDSTDAFRAVFHGLVADVLLLLDGRRPAHIVNPVALRHERWQGRLTP